MASYTSEEVNRGQPDCLLFVDSGLHEQDAWTTGNFGINYPAPLDVVAYFESQPFGSAGELSLSGLNTSSNTAAKSPMSDFLWSQSFDIQNQNDPYITPDFGIATWASGLPFRDVTPHQPSSEPSQDSSSRSRGSDMHTPGSMAQQVKDPCHRLNKNRDAARKFRRNKKKSNTELEVKELELRKFNTYLTEQVARLRNEVSSLKNDILKHAGCDSKLISCYLDREAAKIR